MTQVLELSNKAAMKNVQSLYCVWVFVTLWTVAYQVPLRPRDSPGMNTRAGWHFLLQGIFLTQGLNLSFLHCRRTLYCLSHQGSPKAAIQPGHKSILPMNRKSLSKKNRVKPNGNFRTEKCKTEIEKGQSVPQCELQLEDKQFSVFQETEI